MQLVHHLTGHSYGVTHVCFSPSGTLLASCSWDDTIGLWDVETGRLLQFLRGHTSPVASCAFTVGGSGLVRELGKRGCLAVVERGWGCGWG